MQNIVYWVPDDRVGSQQQLVYLLGHESREAAKESFAGFRQDPEWQTVRAASEKAAGGSLTIEKNGVVSEFLVPLFECRKTRHQPHHPPISTEMPVGMVADVPLTGLSFTAAVAKAGHGCDAFEFDRHVRSATPPQAHARRLAAWLAARPTPLGVMAACQR